MQRGREGAMVQGKHSCCAAKSKSKERTRGCWRVAEAAFLAWPTCLTGPVNQRAADNMGRQRPRYPTGTSSDKNLPSAASISDRQKRTGLLPYDLYPSS